MDYIAADNIALPEVCFAFISQNIPSQNRLEFKKLYYSRSSCC
jgi:hypothetical protein